MRPYVLGAELGSTRIKAVVLDGDHIPVSAGEYQWQSLYENGLWTYPLEQVWQGLPCGRWRDGNASPPWGSRP